MGEKKQILDIFNVKNLVNTLINFIETKIEIYKIQFKEEAAKAISAFVVLVLFAIFGLLFVLFLSIFISELINDLTGLTYVGYVIVAAFYLICIFIIYLVRKKILSAVMGFIFNDDEENIELNK